VAAPRLSDVSLSLSLEVVAVRFPGQPAEVSGRPGGVRGKGRACDGVRRVALRGNVDDDEDDEEDQEDGLAE
jgi:hypothetical protein